MFMPPTEAADHQMMNATTPGLRGATTPAVRFGAIALFVVILLAGAAMFGMAAPRRAPDALSWESRRNLSAMWRTVAILLAAGESAVVAVGSVVVMRMARDVRARRAEFALPGAGDPHVLRARSLLAATDDRATQASRFAEATASVSGATTTLIVLHDEVADAPRPWATHVEDDAAPADAVDDLTPAAVALADATAPRRWVDDGRAWIVVPLRASDGHGGAIVAVRDGDRPFTLGELDRVCQLAEVGVADLPPLVDDVTDLPSRRRLDLDVAAVSGSPEPVGFLVVGLDHALRRRHQVGDGPADDLLGRIAAVLGENVRAGDVVYRYDDDRFGVILPGADTVEAADAAERLRRAVEHTEFDVAGEATHVTVSVGTVVAAGADLSIMVGRADRALAAAERCGRNRVVADLG